MSFTTFLSLFCGLQSSLLLSSTPVLPVTAASWWGGNQWLMLSSTASASSGTARTLRTASTPHRLWCLLKTWSLEPFTVLKEMPGVLRISPEMTSTSVRSHVRERVPLHSFFCREIKRHCVRLHRSCQHSDHWDGGVQRLCDWYCGVMGSSPGCTAIYRFEFDRSELLLDQ